MSWWVDPRVGDECWAQRSPREQWVSLASFLSHVIGRLKHVADEWAGDSRARQRMAVVLCRGGYVQEALGVSRSDWSLAVTDVLMDILMRSGTLGPVKGSDGRPWCLIVEVLEKGVGALFYGLSITEFRTKVALKAVDYVRRSARLQPMQSLQPNYYVAS